MPTFQIRTFFSMTKNTEYERDCPGISKVGQKLYQSILQNSLTSLPGLKFSQFLPFNDKRRKLLQFGWNFQRCFLNLFKKYCILCFDFLSRTVKKLLAILLFLFLEFFYSALFKHMFQNSILDTVLASCLRSS